MNNNNMNGMNPMMNNPMMMNNLMNNPMMMNNMMNNPMFMAMMNNPMMMNNMMNNQAMMNNMMNNPMFMAMMMNMMQNNNQNTGNMGNMNMDSNNPNDWNLIFEKKNGTQVVNIRVSPNETVQHAINMYKLKTNTLEKDDEIKFIFNGKQLNYSLSLAASGLSNASKITVISTKDVEGAF